MSKGKTVKPKNESTPLHPAGTPGQGKYAFRTESGSGGELHQNLTKSEPAGHLTDNFGHRIADNQNSLRAGTRGPTLLEDFFLREKIFHFDHERIPERIVHARGSGAHGVFRCTKAIPELTAASLFQKKGNSCPVFARFSTVAGGARSFSFKMH
jgi:catalase